MVRSVLLAHGLNDNRGKCRRRNKEFKRLLDSVCHGKTVITILYCEDGLPSNWQEKGSDKRDVFPEATQQRYWENLIHGLGIAGLVQFRDFSFKDLVSPQQIQNAISQLHHADIFYIRGTGPGCYSNLVDIVENPNLSEVVSKLQYQVFGNRLLYVGICGGSQLEGDYFWPEKRCRKGLRLFGSENYVQYDSWESPTKFDPNCIQITQVTYVIIDTVLDIFGSFVMTNKDKKAKTAERLAEYESKAFAITENLQAFRRQLQGHLDFYTSPNGKAWVLATYQARAWYLN